MPLYHCLAARATIASRYRRTARRLRGSGRAGARKRLEYDTLT
jgi:hypothetical protein